MAWRNPERTGHCRRYPSIGFNNNHYGRRLQNEPGCDIKNKDEDRIGVKQELFLKGGMNIRNKVK